MRPVSLLCALAALVLAAAAAAQQKKPPLPAGRDPGGVAIAFIGTGIDYTLPQIAQRLARDGEGELIGWDLLDKDNRPFPSGIAEGTGREDGDLTRLARTIGTTGRRVVPVKVDPADPLALGRAVAFIAHTPARIVVVPIWSRTQRDWEAFRQAAHHFKDLLFVVAAGDEGRDIDRDLTWPAAFGLGNMLVVSVVPAGSSGSASAPNIGARTIDALIAGSPSPEGEPTTRTSLAAALAADALAGCWPLLVEAHRGEALKKAFLAEVAKTSAAGAKPIIERCPSVRSLPTKR
jgi:hypothetical protein